MNTNPQNEIKYIPPGFVPAESVVSKEIVKYVSYAAAIVVATIAVVGFFYKPLMAQQKDINALKGNIESHEELTAQIQTIKDENLKDLKSDVEGMKKQIDAIEKSQIRVETILDKRLPSR